MVPALTILFALFFASPSGEVRVMPCTPVTPVILSIAEVASVNDLPTVLVCEGSLAYAYHNRPTCKGLAQCEHNIIEIPEDSAKIYRQPCKLCYKRNR